MRIPLFLSRAAWTVGLTALVLHRGAFAEPPVPLNTAPVAVRGGIVAIPLRMPEPGKSLPAEWTVTLVDGDARSEIRGRVVWLATPSAQPMPRWTRSANPTLVRSMPADVDPREILAGEAGRGLRTLDAAMLLVAAPSASMEATLAINGVEVRPLWIEPGASLATDSLELSIDPERAAEWALDRPDPESPFEWFRWTLVGRDANEPIPAPPGDAASQLFARHVAELWRAGLARIERQSKGVADDLRQWLTATSSWKSAGAAEGPSIATWLADPTELGSLLGILLDRQRDDEVVMQAALAWMDARTPLLSWVESDRAGTIQMVFANPMRDEIVVRTQWLGENLAPLATLVQPRSVERMAIRRPESRIAAVGEPIVLGVQADDLVRRFPFAPRAVVARPPALSFGPFVPPMTLADAQAGRSGVMPEEWTTVAQLRRRAGRWELFAECLAPPASMQTSDAEDMIRLVLQGREVSVRRDGSLDGTDAGDAGLEAHVRAYADRWRLRLLLPEEWLPRPGSIGAVATIGMRRDAGDRSATAVVARVAFDERIPLVEIDLSAWSDGIRPEPER
jgi:hypothetical protein